MDERIPVGVLGATGTVGARLVALLAHHPWFRIAEAGASDRSAGGQLGDLLPVDEVGQLPPDVARIKVRSLEGGWTSPVLLSALPSSVARQVETDAAQDGHLVVSNASAFRTDPDVPLVIPEVNANHLDLVSRQAARWSGAIVTNPNCAVTGLATALAPLHSAFRLERVVVTTFQAISGAGRAGPPASSLVDNVLPFIAGEEEKIAFEPRKILGSIVNGDLVEADFSVGATATRVNVLHGHLVSVSASFERTPGPDDVAEVLRTYEGQIGALGLPSAPPRPLEVLEDPSRPQPRLDRDLGGGMTVSVGRIRECEALDVSFIALAHNLERGAAGAAILNAELCKAKGLVDSAVGRAS